MNVLVTGGCGYIGSVLVPQLLDDETIGRVTIFDNLSGGSPRALIGTGLTPQSAIRFRHGNVHVYGDVEDAMRDIDTVIHLAAITGAASTHDRREETLAVNRNGTENVLKAAGKYDVDNVVVASSCNIYGRATSRDIDETTTPDPLNPYAESKVASEGLLADAIDEHGFTGTALRMSTNYGYAPGVRFNLVVNHFVFQALTERPLTVYGNGSNWRPFIHVHDAARAYKHAACHPDRWPHLVYNVGDTDENYRIAEIAEIVRSELNSDLDITYLRDRNPGPSYHVNFDRVAETNYEPTYTVREGVNQLTAKFTDGLISS